MAAPRHTPGPWQVSRDNDSTLTIVAPWSDKVKTGAEGWGDYRGIHTASITHHSGDGAVPREHAEANAHLIAASPDLLSELKTTSFLLLSACLVIEEAEAREKALNAVKRAGAAIAKATGSAA